MVKTIRENNILFFQDGELKLNTRASAKTLEQYSKIAQTLLRSFERNARTPEDETRWNDFVRWIEARKSRWGKRSFRLIRAAVTTFLFNLGHENAAVMMSAVGIEGCAGASDRNNAKFISNLDLARLERAVSESRGVWSRRTLALFRACLYTGLRPIEWGEAVFDEESSILKVKNAKVKEKDAPTERWLRIETDEARAAVMEILRLRARWEQEQWQFPSWERFRVGCSETMSKIKAAFLKKKNIDLYTARHQFVADAKSAEVPQQVLALMLGHNSHWTARQNYGPRKKGRGVIHVSYAGPVRV